MKNIKNRCTNCGYEFDYNGKCPECGSDLVVNISGINDKYILDKVTVKNLDLAFRMVGIVCDKDTTDKIIDLVELLGVKGDDVNLMDIANLENEWLNN